MLPDRDKVRVFNMVKDDQYMYGNEIFIANRGKRIAFLNDMHHLPWTHWNGFLWWGCGCFLVPFANHGVMIGIHNQRSWAFPVVIVTRCPIALPDKPRHLVDIAPGCLKLCKVQCQPLIRTFWDTK